jgi:hypothetical protein
VGPNSYSVPLSASGIAPASHYGLHSWVDPEFVAMLNAASGGAMPPALVDAGFPPADFAAVVSSLIASVRETSQGHFNAVIAAAGLAVIVPDSGLP